MGNGGNLLQNSIVTNNNDIERFMSAKQSANFLFTSIVSWREVIWGTSHLKVIGKVST